MIVHQPCGQKPDREVSPPRASIDFSDGDPDTASLLRTARIARAAGSARRHCVRHAADTVNTRAGAIVRIDRGATMGHDLPSTILHWRDAALDPPRASD
jgi:hypothetical protein